MIESIALCATMAVFSVDDEVKGAEDIYLGTIELCQDEDAVHKLVIAGFLSNEALRFAEYVIEDEYDFVSDKRTTETVLVIEPIEAMVAREMTHKGRK